jgi:HK97 gp10 family phage protein
MKNLDKLAKKLNALAEKVEKAVQDEIAFAAYEVQGEAVKSIQRSTSKGIVYGKHTASKPGDPPNTDTARLASGIVVEIKPGEARTGTNVEYGPMLEFGTVNMEPRPWLLPAFRKVDPKFKKRINAIMSKAISEAKK